MLPWFIVGTVGLVLATEALVRRGATRGVFINLLPLALAVSMSVVLAPAVGLWISDLMRHPWYFEARNETPIPFSEIMALSGLAYTAGSLICATYHSTRSPAVARAFFLVPAGLSLGLLWVYLKVDRSFVVSMAEGSDNLEIVKLVVALAHTMGKEVIAEGIETPHELAILRGLNCEFGQGYFFARPMPAKEATRLLEQSPRW